MTTPRYLNWDTFCSGGSIGSLSSEGCSANRTDFPQLTQTAKYLPKAFISRRASLDEVVVFLRYKRVSSAYREIVSSTGPVEMPRTASAERKRIATGSIASAKSAGESGHPCLVPLWRQKEGREDRPGAHFSSWGIRGPSSKK